MILLDVISKRGRFAAVNKLSIQRKDALKDVKLRTGLWFGCATFFANGALNAAQEDIPNRQTNMQKNR